MNTSHRFIFGTLLLAGFTAVVAAQMPLRQAQGRPGPTGRNGAARAAMAR